MIDKEKEITKYVIEELVRLGILQPRSRLRTKDLAERYGRDYVTIRRWAGKKLPKPKHDTAGPYWLKDEIEAFDLQFQMSAGKYKPNFK